MFKIVLIGKSYVYVVATCYWSSSCTLVFDTLVFGIEKSGGQSCT